MMEIIENMNHNLKTQIGWIFSIINETENEYFWINLDLLQGLNQMIVVVDGGSSDRTIAELVKRKIKFFELPESTRGERFRFAAEQSQASILVFVHPRTKISTEVILSLNNSSLNEKAWGSFTHSFDSKHIILKFTSWWSNYIRGDLRGIYYLDHVLWARRSLVVEAGGFPGSAIFEDTIFCEKLSTYSSPIRLPQTTVTSAVRFKRNGLAKQIIINQIAKLRFFFRQNANNINEKYESGLDLNGKTTFQGQHAPDAKAPTDDRK